MNLRNEILIPLIFACACDAAPPATIPPPGEEVFDDGWTHANPGSKGPAVLNPDQASGKEARRVSIDQLRRSIPELFTGVTWTVEMGRNQVSAFDALSRTLGEPDYIAINTENRDPSPLFAKYMDDMAGDVCAKAGAQLVMDPDVNANLRLLRLKLHGIWVPDGSMEGLGDLRQLYDDILGETTDTGDAWFGVCVAMLTAPELMAY